MTKNNFFKSFKSTLLSYPAWSLIIIAIISFIAHGSMIFSKAIGVDTEAAILGIEAYDGQGRQGILWLRKLLGMSKFNLWLTNSLTFFLLILVAIVIFTSLSAYKEELSKLLIPFCILFIVSPFWACQLYFLSQSVPVLISLLLIPFTEVIVRYATDSLMPLTKKILFFLATSVLFQFIIGTYQLNMIIYVAYVCCAFVLSEFHSEKTVKDHLRLLITQAVFVIAGFIIYEIITKLFYSQYSDYLTSQIAWSNVGLSGGIINIIHVVGDVVKGAGFYSFLYVPLCIVAFVLSIINCLKAKEAFSKAVFPVLCEIFVFVSPFFFVILFGNDVSPRMRYIFPVAAALVLLLCYSELNRLTDTDGKRKPLSLFKRIAAVAFCIILFADTMKGLNNTVRLYYTNEYRYDQEYLIARDLQRDLNQFFIDNNLPEGERNLVIFMGDVHIEYNDMCLPGAATIGSSSINWDSYMISRGRIFKFMRTAGYPIGNAPYVSDGAFMAFEYYFDEYFGATVDAMPAYPYNGYISEVRDDELGLHYYVVKLGNDWRRDNYSNPR
ncbi:MAG: glucosyltransferase domain-containing protein [Lachnospiraceae bacterium]|nr:glucosyltransferase domain-containing protein [Lachnospiraceae bacterium]